jgi:type III secretory pathway component EscU
LRLNQEIDATGFEAKSVKTVQVILRPNHSQTIAISFDTQSDEKPLPLVLRQNQ